MIQDLSVLFELRRPTMVTQKRQQPVSSLAFDALYAVLTIVLAVGIFIDVWSHSTFGPDQSVLSPYHFLFYSAMGTIGGLLLFTHTTNLRQGYKWSAALPVGYGFSFFGVIFFTVAGIFDLGGHALFGFETGLEAIMSPTHMMLFIGWFIVAIAPIRAAFHKFKSEPARNLGQQLPMILALVSALCAATLASFYYTPLNEMSYAVQEMRVLNEEDALVMEIAGIFIQTGVLMSVLTWIISNIKLKVGILSLLFFLFGVLLAITNLAPIAIVNTFLGGILIEVAYQILQPTRQQVLRFCLFGFVAPILLWGSYYGFYLVSGVGGGLWVTGYVWLGTVFQTGFIGLALAYFVTQKQEGAK
jgi:hypothetical protein